MASALSGHFHSLSSLRQLSLEFKFENYLPDSTCGLSKFLTYLPALQSLRLSFDHLSPYEAIPANLEIILGRLRPWRSLRNLSLQAVHTSDKYLRELLTSHTNTLRWLEFTQLTLFQPDNEGISDDEDGEEPKRGSSFIDLFRFLRATMSLEHARFHGQFLNGWDEAWTSPEPDPEVDYPYDCLKYRIERFITKGEPFPFRELSDDDKKGGFTAPLSRMRCMNRGDLIYISLGRSNLQFDQNLPHFH